MTEQQVPASGQPASPMRLSVACALLTAALAAAYAPVAWFVFERNGAEGVRAATVAVGVCWAAGLLALGLTNWFREGQQAVIGLLLSIFARMGLPLVIGLVLDRRGGPLADAGVFGLIVIFYLVMLVVEMLLALRLVKPSARNS